ncbi:MAG: zinc ribbon domain-containing protein [bacterium]
MPFIKCEYCGKEYEEDPGKFCDYCGRVLARRIFGTGEEGGESVRCKNCGHPNEPDATVCTNCGEKIYERQTL